MTALLLGCAALNPVDRTPQADGLSAAYSTALEPTLAQVGYDARCEKCRAQWLCEVGLRLVAGAMPSRSRQKPGQHLEQTSVVSLPVPKRCLRSLPCLPPQLVKALKQRVLPPPPQQLQPDGTALPSRPLAPGGAPSPSGLPPWDNVRYTWRGSLKASELPASAFPLIPLIYNSS